MAALWSIIDSPNTPRDTRFSLSSILASTSSALIGEGNLDYITLEATQHALDIGSLPAVEVVTSALCTSE
jgi:hypothetical protein